MIFKIKLLIFVDLLRLLIFYLVMRYLVLDSLGVIILGFVVLMIFIFLLRLVFFIRCIIFILYLFRKLFLNFGCWKCFKNNDIIF